MVKASGIKVQKLEKSMFRTNAICVLRQKEPEISTISGSFATNILGTNGYDSLSE